MTTRNFVALPDLAGTLRANFPGAAVPGYRKLDELARDGRLPIIRVNGRRFVKSDDLPGIADLLSLTPVAA